MTGSKRTVRIFAAIAATVFAASMVLFAWSYATRFAVPADPGVNAMTAAGFNVLLFAVFGAHHSVLARTRAKRWVTRFVPQTAERALYVLVASVLFALMAWLWQPVPGVVWHAAGPVAWALAVLQIAGLLLAVGAGRGFDVLDLAGLRQVMDDTTRAQAGLADRGPYAWVRHPLYLGILLILWPVATMTSTRFLFAALTTIYVVIAIPLEERDLRRSWGEEYNRYAERVRSRILPWIY